MALKTISGNWSSRHLVSCSARTSTSRRSSQEATRSARLRMEVTFQVARRTPSALTESLENGFRARATPLRLGADLGAGDDLAAGGDAGAGALPALDEPRRLGVQAAEELGELLAGALALRAEVGALEDLPLAQDGADHLVVVQPEVVDAGLGDQHGVLAEAGHRGAGHLEADDLVGDRAHGRVRVDVEGRVDEVPVEDHVQV